MGPCNSFIFNVNHSVAIGKESNPCKPPTTKVFATSAAGMAWPSPSLSICFCKSRILSSIFSCISIRNFSPSWFRTKSSNLAILTSCCCRTPSIESIRVFNTVWRDANLPSTGRIAFWISRRTTAAKPSKDTRPSDWWRWSGGHKGTRSTFSSSKGAYPFACWRFNNGVKGESIPSSWRGLFAWSSREGDPAIKANGERGPGKLGESVVRATLEQHLRQTHSGWHCCVVWLRFGAQSMCLAGSSRHEASRSG